MSDGCTYAGSEGVERDLVLLAGSTDLFSDLPGVGTINLTHGELVETISVHDLNVMG